MKMKEIIDLFREESALSVRSETLRYDDCQFQALLKHFGEEYELGALTKPVVMSYIQTCKSSNNKNSTINKHLKMLYRLMRYAVENEYVDVTNELEKTYAQIYRLGTLKDDCQSYRTLSDHQTESLVNYIDSLKEDKFISLRNKIILSIMLGTGARRNEVVHIKRSNIDYDNNSIYLETTKTGITRHIYIDDVLKEQISKLIQLMDTLGYNTETEYLFISHQNKCRLTIQGVDEIFRKLKKTLGFTVTPHMLRHTFATECVENEIPLSSLQQLMGHTRLSTTQIYIHLADKRLKKDALRYNPLTTRRAV